MGGRIDLTGREFGRLTVMRYVYTKKKQAFWECKCVCGNVKIVVGNSLLNGNTKSCGCLASELLILRNKNSYTHKCTKTRLYQTWADMKQRCYNEKNNNYKYYGEHGIKICDEWKNNYISFHNWALANGYKENLTIERIDVSKDYCPENCTFVTSAQQAKNKSNNVFYNYLGKTMIHEDWSRFLNVNNCTLRYNIKKHGLIPTLDKFYRLRKETKHGNNSN